LTPDCPSVHGMRACTLQWRRTPRHPTAQPAVRSDAAPGRSGCCPECWPRHRLHRGARRCTVAARAEPWAGPAGAPHAALRHAIAQPYLNGLTHARAGGRQRQRLPGGRGGRPHPGAHARRRARRDGRRGPERHAPGAARAAPAPACGAPRMRRRCRQHLAFPPCPLSRQA